MVSQKTSMTLLGLAVMLLTLGCSTASPTVFNVMAYGAHADGVTDDSAAVERAITAANKVGGTVYFPAGTYRIYPAAATPVASPHRLKIPAGTQLRGAGIGASYLKGKLTIGADSTFEDLRMGLDLGSTYIGTNGSTFDHVRFSGGGGGYESTWPYCDCAGVTISGSHLAFTDCTFDGVQHDDTRHVGKFDNVATFGGSYLIFTRCHWKRSAYFGIEMWSGSSDARRAVHNDFFGCSFDESVAAHIDYALYGASDCTVDDCTFASSGVGPYRHDPGDVTIECGPLAHDITVSDCRMVRSKWCNINIQGAGHDMWIVNNTIDNTAGLTAIPLDVHGGALIYAGGDGASHNNHITGNVIFSLPGELEWSPAIHVIGNNNIVTGNSVTGWRIDAAHASNDPATITATGTGNTTNPNTIK